MHILEIKKFSVKIENKQILNNVNLTIKSGEVHAIMGPNGTGKSTLASAIMGAPAYEVTSGEVLLDGVNILEMPVDESCLLYTSMSLISAVLFWFGILWQWRLDLMAVTDALTLTVILMFASGWACLLYTSLSACRDRRSHDETINVVFYTHRNASHTRTQFGLEPNSLIEEPENPTRNGFIFSGWFKDLNFTQQWDFATDRVGEHSITLSLIHIY